MEFEVEPDKECKSVSPAKENVSTLEMENEPEEKEEKESEPHPEPMAQPQSLPQPQPQSQSQSQSQPQQVLQPQPLSQPETLQLAVSQPPPHPTLKTGKFKGFSYGGSIRGQGPTFHHSSLQVFKPSPGRLLGGGWEAVHMEPPSLDALRPLGFVHHATRLLMVIIGC